MTKQTCRIISDPDILGGIPVLAGTRVPVENVLAALRTGCSKLELFRHYPSLPLDAVEICLAWESEGLKACA